VFAVFATRIDAWMDWPDEVREFHQKLVCAYDYSTANFSQTLASAQAKTGLSLDVLQDYYRGLDYYLDSSHFQGLEQFAALNKKRAV
jgi:predicted solute-binding protein